MNLKLLHNVIPISNSPFGTQDMMECDGCWKAAVFYIQFSYKRSTALPKGGVVGLSLKIHSPKQVYIEKNFHLMLKRPM